jgi:transcription antitermination factor NusG
MAAMPDSAAPKATFAKGDRVMVTSGELVNLEGVVEEVVLEEGKVLLKPMLEGMENELVDVLIEELKKMVSVCRGDQGHSCSLLGI